MLSDDARTRVGLLRGFEVTADEKLRKAFEEPELIAVVNGDGVGASLDAVAVTRIARGPTPLSV